MSLDNAMGDNFSLEPPLWLQQALDLNKNLNENPDEGSQENDVHPSPPAEESHNLPSVSHAENKSEAGRRGQKRKKNKSKEEEKGSLPCDIAESTCIEAPVRPSTVQKATRNDIDSLDVRFRLLRDNYCALRHHYGQLRKKYEGLERKHLKCVSSKKKPRKGKKESEEEEKDFDTDDGLCVGGLAQLEESDETETSGDEEEGKSDVRRRKIRKVTFRPDYSKDEVDMEGKRGKRGFGVFRVYYN